MSNERDILTNLAGHLVMALEPLRESFADEERFKGLMYTLGWGVDGLPQEYIEIASSVASAVSLVEDITEGGIAAAGSISTDGEGSASSSISLSAVAELLATIEDLYSKLRSISSAPPGVDAGAFLGEIGERLFEYLLTEYLSRHQTDIYNLFASLDVIEVENLDVTGSKHAYVRTKMKWAEIPAIFQDPLSIVKRVYGWGTSDLDARAIFNDLSGLLFSANISVKLLKPDEHLVLNYSGEKTLTTSRDLSGLKIPFYYNLIAGVPIELAFDILELPASTTSSPGLIIQPSIPSVVPLNYQLGNDVNLAVKVGSDLGSHFGIMLTPEGIDVKYPFKDAASMPSAGFGLSVDYEPDDPIFLFGSPDGVRMQMQGASLGVDVLFESGEFEVKLLSELKELALILEAGNGDGFLSTLLGDNQIKVDMPLGVDWSSKTGFGFRGSMNLEIAINTHLNLGPIEIPKMVLSLGIPSGASRPQVEIEAGIDVKANLGPLKAVVEQIGLGLYTTFEDGNLGPLDVDIGFKPPTGVGLSIDAGVVTGGGFLRFDTEKEEYDGILELDLSGIVSVTAIGLITTKMPDGSKGFSLLLIITAEFGSPIQLGFGFTLSGVGGLLGLNRTMRLEEIASGIRDGGINSIMFPDNVIENAPRIISDLKKYFPVQEGTFLIGPMVKIGWGTPNLVTVSLGVIIEIPGNIAILGVLRVALPDEDAALVVIQVSFIGAIEFDKKRLWFFASLFESRVLFITLEGEMGLLVGWGDDASFVVSVGGFHPAFNPPPLPFGSIARIAISILNTDFARIRVEGYFAVTSNTVQFGAKVELYFGVSAFNIDGHLAFDALFKFSPFYFIISISASLSVKVFGVGLFSVSMRGSLSGPTPWHVEGTGSISILFFDIDVDFSHTWGNEEDTTLPPITVMPLLMAEFEKMENWQAALPDSNQLLVSLREIQQSTTDLILHPVGSLKVSQRFVPLGIVVDKVGNQKPVDANEFSVTVDPASGLDVISDLTEQFAAGQYLSKSDSQLLSSNSFEPMTSGIELAVKGEQYQSPIAVRRIVRYEEIIVDTFYKRFVRPLVSVVGTLFALFLNGNAVAKSSLSFKNRKKLSPFDEKVKVGNTQYGVAFNVDNTPFTDEATSKEKSLNFTSQAQAEDFMKKMIQRDANLAKQIHVIPQVEIRDAA